MDSTCIIGSTSSKYTRAIPTTYVALLGHLGFERMVVVVEIVSHCKCAAWKTCLLSREGCAIQAAVIDESTFDQVFVA